MLFGSNTCNPFITLACDFKCPYCITRSVPGYDFGYQHRNSAEWALALNNLEDVEYIVFNGGEPTLRPGFPALIDAIHPSDKKWPDGWKIAVGSNGSERACKVLAEIRPRADLIIDLSFHPTDITLSGIVATATTLLSKGHNVRIHTVSWPAFGVTTAWLVRQLVELGLDVFQQNFDGWYDGQPKGLLETFPGEQVACDLTRPARSATCHRTIYTPVAPNGDVYWCHTHMYARDGVGVIGNILDGWMSDKQTIECARFGHCNPCDRPRKTEVHE